MRLRSVLSASLAGVFAVLISGVPVAAAADDPPPLEEEYDYPGAEKIFQEKGIRLKKGNGKITLTDCPRTGVEGVLAVQRRTDGSPNQAGQYCFKLEGNSGFITMELPKAYFAKGLFTTDVVLRTATETKTVRLNGQDWTPIGEGTGGPDATLLEFRVTA
ncbi:hypothetical protein [Crossiella sp. CA198]|uniref:hypothetical protein n=1 Tax=Crossiella sp. CA198 TaxID=3455607 RepID=UPI003F8D58B8